MKKKLEELPDLLREALQSPKNKLSELKESAMKTDFNELSSNIQAKIKSFPEQISANMKDFPDRVSTNIRTLPEKAAEFARSPPRLQLPDIRVDSVTDNVKATFDSLREVKVTDMISKLPKSPKEAKEAFFTSIDTIKGFLSPKNKDAEYSSSTRRKKEKQKKIKKDNKKVNIKRGEEWRYDDDGNVIYDEYGNPLYDEWGNPLYDEYGNPLYDELGRPLYDAEGNYLYDDEGNYLGYETEPLDEYEAKYLRPGILRKNCVQCGHIHHEGQFCHVFIPYTREEKLERRRKKKELERLQKEEEENARRIMEGQEQIEDGEEYIQNGTVNEQKAPPKKTTNAFFNGKWMQGMNPEKKRRRSSMFNIMNMLNQNPNYQKDSETGKIIKVTDPIDVEEANKIQEDNDSDSERSNAMEEEDYTLWLDDPADIPGGGVFSSFENQVNNQISKLTDFGSEGLNFMDSVLSGETKVEFDKDKMKAKAEELTGNLKNKMLNGFNVFKEKANQMTENLKEMMETPNVQDENEDPAVETIETLDQLDSLLALDEPEFIDRIDYHRCGCMRGVPYHDPRYEKLSSALYAEANESFLTARIKINTGNVASNQIDYFSPKVTLNEEIMDLGILHFLNARDVANCLTLSRSWFNYMTKNSIDYHHMKNIYPYITFQAHKSACSSIGYSREVLYTAGDKALHCYHAASGVQVKANVFRDMCHIKQILMDEPSSLITTYVNGEMKKWNLCFDVSSLTLGAKFDGHARSITNATMAIPSENACSIHSIEKHACFIYTVSEDRNVSIWDNKMNVNVRKIRPCFLLGPCLTAVAISKRHLFVASSRGDIAVFSLTNKCERKDRHNCSDPNIGHQAFCDQKHIKYKDRQIFAMTVCGTKRKPQSLLVIGNQDGDVVSYSLPLSGIDIQESSKHLQVHPKGVTAIKFFSGKIEEKSLKIYNECALNTVRSKYGNDLLEGKEDILINSFEYLAIGGNDCTVTLWKIGDTTIHFLRRLSVSSRVKEIILVPILESQSPQVASKKAEWTAIEEARRAALTTRLAKEAKKKGLRDMGNNSFPAQQEESVKKVVEEENSIANTTKSKASLQAEGKEKPKSELHVNYLYVALANGQVQSYGLGFAYCD